MYDPYVILGLIASASKDDAKKAFRSLASKFHPDKFQSAADKANAEEQFKRIKSAWEAIDNGWVRPPPEPPKPEPVYSAPPKATHWRDSYADTIRPNEQVVVAYRELDEFRKFSGDFVARPSITQAFRGFTLLIPTPIKQYRIQIPPGVPSGIRLQVAIGYDTATVCILFTQSQYQFTSISTAKKEQILYNGEPALVYRTKDLHTWIDLNVSSFRGTKTIDLIDLAGQMYSVKVFRDQDFRKGSEVPNLGYYDWITSHSIAGTKRGSVFVHFRTTENLEMSHNIRW